ncbi:site-specific integrase [uncultured Prochlorococcus sp.]|uniref:tyrosine-type recombinase/integrase n=1 Tax=uncultured Prochlorococcus sp. TaxID=159733 RepID=UPI002590A32D|nr:site-specific integrase [uncultured Prochlorococcus sp.]
MHQTYDDTEMATIRRSGSGWQVLIRRKNYVGPRSRTFLSRDLAQSWANAVEDRKKKVFRDNPITLGEAINDYINGPLLLHRSAENEKYPLRVTAESWLGDIPMKDLQIKHFAVWRDERLLKVKPNTVMRELRILRVLIDWARDERGAEIKDNPARHLRVRGTGDARAPFFTDQDEKRLIYELSQMSNQNHLRLTKLALATGFRRSELLSLNWRNIDLKKRIIYMNRKNCAATDYSSGVRLVPLPGKAQQILEELSGRNGKIIELSKGAARNGFDKARTKAGLESLRFHDLRHIAISRMWSSGMNALEISACSGHRDIKMLMRYSHYQLSF